MKRPQRGTDGPPRCIDPRERCFGGGWRWWLRRPRLTHCPGTPCLSTCPSTPRQFTQSGTARAPWPTSWPRSVQPASRASSMFAGFPPPAAILSLAGKYLLLHYPLRALNTTFAGTSLVAGVDRKRPHDTQPSKILVSAPMPITWTNSHFTMPSRA